MHHAPERQPTRPHHTTRRAFTILEAALVTVVVGVAVVAVLELLAAGAMSNSKGAELATSVALAANVRELAMGLAYKDPEQPGQWETRESTITAYDDVKDLDGLVLSPPVDVRGLRMNNLGEWAQSITVETVAEDALKTVGTKDPAAPTARVTVRIMHHGREVHRLTWLAAAPGLPPS